MTPRSIAILGAGPVGLEAALAAAEAGWAFTVFEASSDVAGNVRAWGHVQLFTPWSMNVSPRVRTRLAELGREPPNGAECPTGDQLADQVFQPLAAAPEIAPHMQLGTRILEISRDGLLKSDEIGTGGRARHTFRLLVRGADGQERVEHADVVLDCTGTYDKPNALGLGGIAAPGERDAEDYIIRQIPDFGAPILKGDAPGWGGMRILLVGSGHSAQTVARDLLAVIKRVPETRVTWTIRRTSPTFGAVDNDALPARDRLVEQARALAYGADSPFDVRLGRSVHALEAGPDGIVVSLRADDGSIEHVVVDRIISMTGSVGDARMYRQLQVHECYATSGPMNLAAALMASSSADCLTQESQGVDTLKNPEPDFYILGSKSYGRNSTFLLRVGWAQVDEVFSLLSTSPPVVPAHA
ncbi:MAG: lysine N(6)-hydroxylase/L-ornithine N(5)-oxygenase family protein [Longimicrobiales bacterium]|nr:lysine N(6)-hydroxylase/L-ornithine N(5)-oxygenase family protein [Longimicrobiales bacterium]